MKILLKFDKFFTKIPPPRPGVTGGSVRKAGSEGRGGVDLAPVLAWARGAVRELRENRLITYEWGEKRQARRA